MPDWHSIDGWWDDDDATALRSLLEKVPVGGSTVHVGIYCGRHLASCADVIRDRKLSVVAVDTWRGSDGGYVVVGENPPRVLTEICNWPMVAIQFGATITRFAIGSEIEVSTRGSLYTAATFRLNKRQFDLVLLDADHTYELFQADILAWLPLVKPGGIVCGHDWGNPDYPGVKRAAEEQLPGAKLIGGQVWGWCNDD